MSAHLSPEILLLHDAGELESGEARDAAAHIAGCAECAARLREFRGLGALIAKGAEEAPSAERRDRALAAAFARRPFRIVGWAAALAAAVILVVVLTRARTHREPPQVQAANSWVERHRGAVGALGRPAIGIARSPVDTGTVGGTGESPDLTEEAALARAREAVASWQDLVHTKTVFPGRVPNGMRFREARPADAEGVVQLLFEGGGKSISIFVKSASGPDKEDVIKGSDGRERCVLEGAVDGLGVVLVEDGIGLEELKKVRASLTRVETK